MKNTKNTYEIVTEKIVEKCVEFFETESEALKYVGSFLTK